MRIMRFAIKTFSFWFLLLALIMGANAAPGDVDPTLNAGNISSGFGSAGIRIVVLQPDGKILIGGFFDSVGGVTRQAVARLNSDGTLDTTFVSPFVVAANIPVIHNMVVQPDGKILVAGSGLNINNTPYSIVRLNTNGSVDPSFTLMTMAVSRGVEGIALQPDGKILIGGDFSNIGPETRNTIARLNADGSLDPGFVAVAPNFGGRVVSIVLQPDGKILAGGDFFATSGSTTLRNIVRLETNGTPDPSLVTTLSANGNVASIALRPDGKIYVGGPFSSINGTSRMSLARINSDGTLDAAFDANLPISEIRSVLLQPSGKLLIGGNFFLPGDRRGFARLNPDGTLDSFNPSGTPTSSPIVNTFALQADNKVLIGGEFISIGGIPRIHIARLVDTPPVVGSFSILQSVIGGGGASYSGGVFGMTATVGQSLAGVRSTGGGFAIESGFWGGARSIRNAPFDFDGDEKTDIGIFRPLAAAEWWINRSSTGATFALQFGSSTDRITPADFTGDGKADIAFFRPSSGDWYVLRSEDFSFFALPFGTTGDVPVPADYDADGKADFAVFRPSSSTWFISQSGGAPTQIVQFGISGDRPVVADYDGDGRADIGIFRPGPAEWWIQRSTAGSLAMQFGNSADKPVEGDYTGDGKADVAIWRPSTGEWYVVRSEDSSFYGFPFGASSDTVAPGDYDGDGKFDPTVFRPSSATWFIARSTAGTQIVQFGATGDRPVANAFVP